MKLKITGVAAVRVTAPRQIRQVTGQQKECQPLMT
jgi:hypothetical protein